MRSHQGRALNKGQTRAPLPLIVPEPPPAKPSMRLLCASEGHAGRVCARCRGPSGYTTTGGGGEFFDWNHARTEMMWICLSVCRLRCCSARESQNCPSSPLFRMGKKPQLDLLYARGALYPKPFTITRYLNRATEPIVY